MRARLLVLQCPSHLAGLRVHRKKLPLLLCRMTVDESVAKHRRTHVHCDAGILPDFGCLPFAVSLRQGERVCALTWSGNDQIGAGPKRRRDVLVPFIRKGERPQLFTIFAVDTDDGTLSQRDDLLLAIKIDDLWRGVTWSNS